jgi:hypothetical protein
MFVRTPKQMEATGVALFLKHAGYATFNPLTEAGTPSRPSGLYRLAVGSKYAEWQPVQLADQTELFSRLLGRDDNYLVHLEGTGTDADSSTAKATIYWTGPSD